ncbi:MAG: DNA-3-methyladenine glycosylase [Nonlabens sp.]
MKLPAAYYKNSDVVFLARDLIGKIVVSTVDDKFCSGIITETEAYRGIGDKACHAHLGRFTDRTKIMYESGGVAYVYLCYGIHHLFNIITNTDSQADAILIRAVQPVSGIHHMMERRAKVKNDHTLTSGPGNFSKAFGLNKSHYGEDLTGDLVYLEHDPELLDTIGLTRDEKLPIVESKRIGIDYAGEDAHLPWRFYLQSSAYISKKLKGDRLP